MLNKQESLPLTVPPEAASALAEQPEGRLELTWTWKHRRLLAADDHNFDWVSPADYRVAEVRLLHEHSEVGEVPAGRAQGNLLIRGDALHALRSLTEIPEFSRHVAGKVKCCYIDPPFNTGEAFEHYDDGLEHSVWLTMMRDRLQQIRTLLAPGGTVWVHLDDAEAAYCRVLMDEVFGRGSFIATVIWKRRNDPRNTAQSLSADHDYILVYAKDMTQLRLNELPRTEEMETAYSNPDNDPRGPWRMGDLAARNPYSRGTYEVTTPSGRVIPGPPSGSYWRVSREELARLDEDHRIYWGADGSSRPYLKRFRSEVRAGRVASTVWHPEEVGFVRNGKEEVRALVGDVFATPKPEKLLQRIIALSTNPGDLVLDCFAGSGTTAAVAHKNGRRWIAIEWNAQTIADFTLPRLAKVVEGTDSGGVTTESGWPGGGGFRILDVGPSMYTEEAGLVMLADWATNGALAEATAAQLGFEYDPEDRPFCGRKGRRRLAVLDGLVDANMIRLLLGALPEGWRVVVAGASIDPSAAAELPKGSRLRKIPDALLQKYERESTLTKLIPPSSAISGP
jgi:adenine-specific DNA-methyltransferase